MFEPNILVDVLDTFPDNQEFINYKDIFMYKFKTHRNKSYDRDMGLQKDWFLESGANFGIFKFKLPVVYYGSQKYYKYLNGEIVFQAWSPVGSTESRLYINKFEHKGEKTYDAVKYYNQMKYFNIKPRLTDMRNELVGNLNNTTIEDIWDRFFGKDNIIGADCWIETQMLLDYFNVIKYNQPTKYDIINTIADTTLYIKKMVRRNTQFRFRNDKDAKEYAETRDLHSQIFINSLDYTSKLKDPLVCPEKITPSY
jgi:hypothetical protein